MVDAALLRGLGIVFRHSLPGMVLTGPFEYRSDVHLRDGSGDVHRRSCLICFERQRRVLKDACPMVVWIIAGPVSLPPSKKNDPVGP